MGCVGNTTCRTPKTEVCLSGADVIILERKNYSRIQYFYKDGGGRCRDAMIVSACHEWCCKL